VDTVSRTKKRKGREEFRERDEILIGKKKMLKKIITILESGYKGGDCRATRFSKKDYKSIMPHGRGGEEGNIETEGPGLKQGAAKYGFFRKGKRGKKCGK